MLTDLQPPPVEPISIDEAKAFLRIDHADEDTLIATLIRSACERLEDRLNLAMIARPMRFLTTSTGEICLPRWPVVSVAAVQHDQEMIADYSLDLNSRPARLFNLPSGEINIDFTAGYGTQPSDVPAPLRQAMLLLIARGFEIRGDEPDTLPLMVDALTMPYRVVGL